MNDTTVLQWSHDWSVMAEPVLWPLWPICFILALWLGLCDLRSTLRVLPRPRWCLLGPRTARQQEEDEASVKAPLLKVLGASNHNQAWRLGTVAAKFDAGGISEEDAVAEATGILQPAGQAAGQPTDDPLGSPLLDGQSLLQIGELYSTHQPSASALARISSAFTTANVLWSIGAVGMAVAFFPALFVLLRPLMPVLLTAHYLLLPFYGLLLYSAWLYVVLAAARYDGATAPFIAFTGSALALSTFIMLGADVYQNDTIEVQAKFWAWFPNTVYMFGLCMFTPLASAYSSRLLGFAASATLFAALHFLVIPFGLGVGIGWANDHDMLVTSVTAGCFIVALAALRVVRLVEQRHEALAGGPYEASPGGRDAFGEERMAGASAWSGRAWRAALRVERAARPFRLGLSCFGCITLLLAGMIYSSLLYLPNEQPGAGSGFLSSYAAMNIAFVVEVLAVLGAGALLSDASFINTGATFLVLWCVEKVLEVSWLDTWVVMFLGSCAMVGAAFFLKTHPKWVIAMLGDFEPLPPPAHAATATADDAEETPLLGVM